MIYSPHIGVQICSLFRWTLCLLNVLLFCWSQPLLAAEQLLSLEEAERIAVENDPVGKQIKSQQDSFSEQAVSANTWPDPSLTLGVMNISADSWLIDQEPMTQTVIGISQRFPPFGAVGAQSEQMMAMSDGMGYAFKEREMAAVLNVRKSWLDVYEQHQSHAIITESLKLFKQLIQITQFQYRAGRGNQQDVIRAQLEESLLMDKLSSIETMYEKSLALLTQWIGGYSSARDLDMQFPQLPGVMDKETLYSNLERHPSVLARKSRINAAENGVNFARAQRRPGWMLNMQYGIRAAERDDLFSAMISFDLPLFSRNRQDRMVAAKESDKQAAQFDLDDWLRQMQKRVDESFSMYNRATQRVELYHNQVLPQAEQNTKASLNAYQSGVTDFNVLMRARLTELNSQLQFVKLNVERAKAQSELLYLGGSEFR